MSSRSQRTGYRFNHAVYHSQTRIYTDANQVGHDLTHMDALTVTMPFRYRDTRGKVVKGAVNVEVRFNPHCYTREKQSGDTEAALVFDTYDDGSQKERVFDAQRYAFSLNLPRIMKNLPRLDCTESRLVGKCVRLERRDRQRPNVAIYIIMRMRKMRGNQLVLFVETAHQRNNEPYGMQLKNNQETYQIILGRLLATQWPECLPPPPQTKTP